MAGQNAVTAAGLNGLEGRFILKYFLIDRPQQELKPTRVK